MVVDRRPPAAGGDRRADAGRHHFVTGGQASESAKPAFVVIAAWLFAESARRPEMPATSMAMGLLMMLVSLLVMEPDFGQTMLILMVWGALFFIAAVRMCCG